MRTVSRDFLGGLYFSGGGGPKAFFTGLAHHIARRSEAAQAEWRTALQAVEHRLAAQPNAPFMLYWKARLLACLGESVQAEQVFRVFAQLRSSGSGPTVSDEDVALVWDLLGQRDNALRVIERALQQRYGALLRMRLRFDPQFDPLRGDPRFEALLKEPEKKK